MAPLVSAPYGAGLRRPPRLRHRRLRHARRVAVPRAARARRARSSCCAATSGPAARSTLDGTEARCTVVARRPARRRADRARRSASTRSTPCCTSPRRRSSAPRTARRARPSSRTCAAPGTCSRPAALHGVRADDRRRLRQGLRPERRAARTPRTCRCARAHPYDASKAAADLIARSYWHTYGLPVAVDAVREHLRRRRPEPLAADPRGDRRGARGPRAGRALRRLARARLPLRRGRRRAPTWRSPTCSTRAPPGGEAFNAGGGVPRSVLDVVRAVCAAGGRRPRARTCAGPARRRRDRPPVGRSVEARAASRGWAAAGRPRRRPAADDRLVSRQPGVPRGRLSARSRQSRRLGLTHGRAFQVGGDQAQEGDRRRAPRQALHEARARDHRRREGGRGRHRGQPVARRSPCRRPRTPRCPRTTSSARSSAAPVRAPTPRATRRCSTRATARAASRVLVEALTDNRNRTGSDVRHAFTKPAATSASRARSPTCSTRRASSSSTRAATPRTT